MSGNGTAKVFGTRDLILAASDVEYQDVDMTREWGCWVRVRSISAAERERLMKGSVVIEGKGKSAKRRFDMPTFRVKLTALAMVDENGTRLFSEDDVFVLGKKSAKALEKVADVATELAGLQDDTDEDDEEDDDSLTSEGKASGTIQSIASPLSFVSHSEA